MTRNRKISVAGLLVCAALWMPTPASADPFAQVRDAVRKNMEDNRIPAMAVAVWRNDEILWQEGFGWSDTAKQVATTENTPFCLASLSKTMTAVGLMTLVQSGKVNLDAPVNRYLGADALLSRVGDPDAVTVRRLANHTSGVAASDQFFYGEEAAKLPTPSETIRRYAVLATPAGERYRYSNMGYGVLGELIARVSGETYASFMRHRVFAPLGMKHSSVDVAPEFAHLQAVRYDFDRRVIPFYVSAEPASASIYASVHDVARFGMFLLKRRPAGQAAILNDQSIDRMTFDPTTINGSPVRVAADGNGYGIGLKIWQDGGYRLVGHNGSSSGVSSAMTLVPSAGLGVAFLANVDGATLGALTQKVLTSLLPDYRIAPRAPSEPSVATPFEPTAELIGVWNGKLHTYEGDQPMRLQIFPSGDVHVRIGAEPRFANRSTYLQDALVNDVEFEGGALTGTTLAQIQTSDTKRGPHSVSLDLHLRGDVINGVATASAIYEGLWRFGLPYWIELKRGTSSPANATVEKIADVAM